MYSFHSFREDRLALSTQNKGVYTIHNFSAFFREPALLISRAEPRLWSLGFSCPETLGIFNKSGLSFLTLHLKLLKLLEADIFRPEHGENIDLLMDR